MAVITNAVTVKGTNTNTAKSSANIDSLLSNAKLVVNKSASPLTVYPGDPLLYTITIENQGTEIANSVYVDDSCGTGIIFDSVKFTPDVARTGETLGVTTLTVTITQIDIAQTITIDIYAHAQPY